MKPKHWKIKVIWLNGEEEFLQMGSHPGKDAVFMNKNRALEQATFMMEGMAEEVQSINVVPA